MQLLGSVFLALAIGWAAQSTSGYLVDSACYEVAYRHSGSATTVDRDMKMAIKHCAPNPQTKSFGLVEKDWSIIDFDPAGNAKAAELLRKTVKQSTYRVTVAGEVDQKVLKVDSISMAQ
jgi:DMSO/TMAO reductase YedYZ molybdopterin-dependent catalytic subunit